MMSISVHSPHLILTRSSELNIILNISLRQLSALSLPLTITQLSSESHSGCALDWTAYLLKLLVWWVWPSHSLGMVKMSARLPRGCYSWGSAACKAATRRSDRQSELAGPWAVSVVSGGHPRNTINTTGGGLDNVASHDTHY